jgi:hypothetical protein
MVSSVKLVIYIFLIIMVVSLAINYELFALLVLCGFFAGIFALSIVIEEFKQLISLTRELKSYGK